MNYRKAKQEDVEQIYELCKRNNLDTPTFGLCFVAEDENKKIVGYCNTVPMNFIDMASDNPLSTIRLLDHTLGALSGMGIVNVLAMTKKENVKKLLEKNSFKKIKTEIEIWTKEL
jgi:N-acetylglutamate synthase-like GNAT family acetyltransferase